MNRTAKLRTSIAVLIVLTVWTGMLYAQNQLGPVVVAGGGGPSSSETRHLIVTVGQPVVGTTVSSTRECQTGFWELLTERIVTAVEGQTVRYPNQFFQNAPNPFNPRTTIQFSLAEEADTVIEVFDLKGRRVVCLLDETVAAGKHSIVFHPKGLSSGVYLLRLQAGDYSASRRLMLLK